MKKVNSIRWSVESAAPEFGVSPKTLSGRIKTRGVVTGDDGKFSTKDICRAVFSDLQWERTRLAKEMADVAERKRKKLDGELLAVDEVRRVWSEVIIYMRQVVAQSALSLKEKAELRKLLAAVPFETTTPPTTDPDGRRRPKIGN